jgi:hypothetical protein
MGGELAAGIPLLLLGESGVCVDMVKPPVLLRSRRRAGHRDAASVKAS